MTKGINKVVLIGNLGKVPETRYTPSGGAVTNITVATSKREAWGHAVFTRWERYLVEQQLTPKQEAEKMAKALGVVDGIAH